MVVIDISYNFFHCNLDVVCFPVTGILLRYFCFFSNGSVISGRVFLVDRMIYYHWYRCTISVCIGFYKYFCTLSWLVPGTELKKPRVMAISQVGFTGLKNVTCRKWISSDIVFFWHAEFAKLVYCCSVSLHNLFLQSWHPFHTTWSFLVTSTSLLVNRTLNPASQSGAVPMSKWRCRTGIMWYFIASFGMYLTRISHSCGFFKVDRPVVPTVIVLFGGLLF